jgi:hypothetical protein
MIHQKLNNMKKNLTEEIQTIRKNMGLVTESTLKISRRLAQDLYEYLSKKYRNNFNPYKADTERLRQYLDYPDSVSANEVEDIVGRLMDTDVKAKRLIGDIIFNEWEKNASKTLENFRKRILVAKNKDAKEIFRGGSSNYDETVNEIKRRVDAANITGYNNPKIIDDIKKRLKTKLEKIAYQIYNLPSDQFAQGFRAGKYDQNVTVYTGFRYALNKGYQFLKKGVSYLSKGKIKKWDAEFDNIYTPEQKKLINQWFIAGLPDTPSIYNAFKEKGLLFATGRSVRQLWKKYLVITFYAWVIEFFKEYSAPSIDEKELTQAEKEEIDKQGTLGDLAVQINNAWRTLDFAPALKYTSPLVFGGYGLVKAFGAGGRGDAEILEKRIKKYLFNAKEENFSLKPSELIDDMIWMAKHIPEVSKSISQELAETRRQLQAQGELARNNQKVDSTDKVVTADTKKTPDTTQTVKTPVSTDTMALYKKFLKEKYPKRTFENPVSLGNNRFKPESTSNFIQQFDGKTFNTIKN